MIKIRTVALMLLFTSSFTAFASDTPGWFKESFLDIREEIDEAASENRRVLLYFHQEGCPYCERMLKVNFTQRDIEEKTREQFNVIAINIWGDLDVTDFEGSSTTEKGFAQALQVQFTPTMLLLDESGAVTYRLNGYYPPNKFLALLDYSSQHSDSGITFRQFLAKRDGGATKGELNSRDDLLPHPLNLQRKAGDRPLLVLFEQKNCKSCDEMHGDAFSRPEIQALLKKFDIAQIDSWSPEKLTTPDGKPMTAMEWSDALKINYTPTLLFIGDGGNELFRTDSYIRPYHLSTSLSYVANGVYKRQPEFQRYILERIDERRKSGKKGPVELWK